ncbi:MAG TPA: hypothetical protein VHQ46_02890 [Desulfobacteria bacterium]|nr:hypothetical protein [Desulfobacteria bacterium]
MPVTNKEDQVFMPNDVTKFLRPLLALIWAAVFWWQRNRFYDNDYLAVAFILAILSFVTSLYVLIKRELHAKRLEVDREEIRLIARKSVVTLPLTEIAALEKRNLTAIRSNYAGFFAVCKNGQAMLLFRDGEYSEQFTLTRTIAEATGLFWIEQGRTRV